MMMQFDSLSDALIMDGHGFYVWLAVGTSLFIMMAMVLIPRCRDLNPLTTFKLADQISFLQGRKRGHREAADEWLLHVVEYVRVRPKVNEHKGTVVAERRHAP